MKNTKAYLLVVIGVFLVTSCTNNDDDTNFVTEIEGEWRLTSLASINPYDFNNDGQPSTNIMLETNCYLNEIIVFNSDNTAYLKNTSSAEIISMLIPGTANSYAYATGCLNKENLISFNWGVDGNNIIIIDNADADTEILPVNNNQFSFTSDNALIVKKSINETILLEEDLEYTFTKN